MPSFTKIWLTLLFIFLAVGLPFAQERDRPLEKSVFAFRYMSDEGLDVDVYLQYTLENKPIAYSAHLETDVCSDGLCKPVNITIQWDLLGRFHSYHTDGRHVLTKFDHIELTQEDHRQLHKILSDTASILRDYKVEDMIDTAVHVRSQQVDAVTRATSVTFDGATVEGALYTVYTLWHFTNGPVRRRILEHTESLLSDPFVKYMLHSGKRDYVSFIFKNISSGQRNSLTTDIIKLIEDDDEYIPHFALAQLGDSILSIPSWQHELLNRFPQATTTVKNAFLARLSAIQVDNASIDSLISFLPELRENQIIAVFSIIEKNKARINGKTRKSLETLSQSNDTTIARHAKNTLKRIH